MEAVQEESLDIYYRHFFPYQQLIDWISYGNDADSPKESVDSNYLLNREWSFTLQDDVYIRYQSFPNVSQFRAEVMKRKPHKIDLGAVFSAPPKDHNTIDKSLFQPLERELIFDIDMTDYDNLRSCCEGAKVCPKCWPYMTMAIQVIHQILQEDFNFRNILWVFSGRRGVHCWVCDPEARKFANEVRSGIVDYMSVETGTKDNTDRNLKSIFKATMHPLLRRAYQTLEPYFEKYVVSTEGQNIFADKFINQVGSKLNPFEKVQEPQLIKDLRRSWDKSLSSEDRWEQIKRETTSQLSHSKKKAKQAESIVDLEAWRYELVFTYCYPKLDVNVSKSLNHLLKIPFCVHPKTGKVCIPIDPEKADEFDIESVPTIGSLLHELEEFHRKNPSTDADQDENLKTSMKSSLELFNRVFLKDMKGVNRALLRAKKEQNSAAEIDF